MSQALLAFVQSLGAFGYVFIFILIFAESGLLLPLPGETGVLIGGVLAYEGVFELPLVMITVCLGAILGDATGYLIGRGPGRRYFLTHGRLLFLRRETVDKVGRFMTRYGGRAIFFARFVSVLRIGAPFVAGLTSQPARRFFPYNLPAGIIWGIGFSLVGYLAGNAWEKVHHVVGDISFVIVGLLVVGALFWIVRRRTKPGTLTPAAQDALPIEERHGDEKQQ